jgi:hypothetical protein
MRKPRKRFLHTGVPNNDCGDGARQRDEAVVALVTPESLAGSNGANRVSSNYFRIARHPFGTGGKCQSSLQVERAVFGAPVNLSEYRSWSTDRSLT